MTADTVPTTLSLMTAIQTCPSLQRARNWSVVGVVAANPSGVFADLNSANERDKTEAIASASSAVAARICTFGLARFAFIRRCNNSTISRGKGLHHGSFRRCETPVQFLLNFVTHLESDFCRDYLTVGPEEGLRVR